MNRVNPEKVFWRRVGDRTIVCRVESGFSYALDETAGLIWDALTAGHSYEKIIASLSEKYGIDAATAQKDVRDFLEELRVEGLMEHASGPPG